jgi:hypothetical protein
MGLSALESKKFLSFLLQSLEEGIRRIFEKNRIFYCESEKSVPQNFSLLRSSAPAKAETHE